MTDTFSVQIEAWAPGAAIPARFAFGKPGTDGPFALSDNVSPAIRWTGAPEGTKSFALLCVDPDVPSSADDVNQEGKVVPSDLPRVRFYHWVLVNIPATTAELPEGAGSEGVVARGKPTGKTAHGVTGVNNYTDWFAGDADMEGTYGDYDGPCPPWNDSIVHHYHFEVFALDVEALELGDSFTGPDVEKAIEGHVLAKASHMGTYSMNPDVPA
ncbi:MAG: YbhB/YbcL family Raf kinase inhibitor-like protein [Myxococcota bacterium]